MEFWKQAHRIVLEYHSNSDNSHKYYDITEDHCPGVGFRLRIGYGRLAGFGSSYTATHLEQDPTENMTIWKVAGEKEKKGYKVVKDENLWNVDGLDRILEKL